MEFMKDCQFQINLTIRLNWLVAPETTAEKVKRAEIQNHIDFKVFEWIHNQKNQQNLMNMILGNDVELIIKEGF